MKKIVSAIFLLIILFGIVLFAIRFKNNFCYIQKDDKYQTEFLCFLKNRCYYTIPGIINIKGKDFTSFGNYYYYDLSTYNYDEQTKTYSVNMLIDRDPATDLEICNKSPYDNGNITHLLFNLKYNPSKKIFKAEYIGFASSKDLLFYGDDGHQHIKTDFINIYYDNNPNLIEELDELLNYYNNEAIKTFDKINGEAFGVEIVYIIKRYLDSK